MSISSQQKGEEDIASLLFSFVRLVGKNARAKNGESLSFAHLKTFYWISENAPPTMKEVATYFGITPPSATSMVNKFVQEGYIIRVLDELDRRTIRLKLTERGKEKLQQCTQQMSEQTHELMNKLTKTEKKEFARIMKKIIDN